jgi:uncharacterized membrane protein
LIQLTDIAVRALSPGVNDPSTAADVVVHIGSVLTALWEREPAQYAQSDGDRTIVSPHVDHRDHLRRAFDPIRRYAAEDPVVLGTMLRTLRLLRSETLRRTLPGPIEPIDQMIDDIVTTARREGWSAQERTAVEA